MTAESTTPRKKFQWFDFGKIEFAKLKPMHFAALIPVCVALNVVGSFIATSVKLPFYLDMGGTILMTMIAGYVPGLAVGILTFIVTGLLVNPTDFYFIPAVFIFVLVLWLCLKYGLGRTWPGFIITLIIFAGSLTLTVTPIVYWAFGGFFGTSIDIATAVFAATFDDILKGALVSNFLLSIVDKGILFFVVLGILRALPPYMRVASPIHED